MVNRKEENKGGDYKYFFRNASAVIMGMFFSRACSAFPVSSSMSFTNTTKVFLLTEEVCIPPNDSISFTNALSRNTVNTIFFPCNG